LVKNIVIITKNLQNVEIANIQEKRAKEKGKGSLIDIWVPWANRSDPVIL